MLVPIREIYWLVNGGQDSLLTRFYVDNPNKLPAGEVYPGFEKTDLAGRHMKKTMKKYLVLLNLNFNSYFCDKNSPIGSAAPKLGAADPMGE